MRRYLVVGVALVLLFAACGDDDGDDGGTASGSSSTSSSSSSSTTTEASSGEAAAVVVADSPLGSILTDADGATLYVFTNDSDGQSACTGQCAATWPPLAAAGEPTGDDAVTGELGTIERDDGTTQVTIEGMPLYHFAPDAGAAGSVKGQGVGGFWFVVGPDGTINREAPPAA
jgi:predicted lipoprotein with Yx(FWY)xxD motif